MLQSENKLNYNWHHYVYFILTYPFRGTQREYSSKPIKYSIVKRILVFER